MFGWLTDRRRRRILQKEFPAAWAAVLEKNVAAYELLDAEEQTRLRQLVQVFLAEKNFEGCGGLEIDDEMRVTIAGTGCLMLLGRDHDLFKEVESILVYPSTVIATDMGRSTFDSSGRVVEEGKAVLGLAVHGGAVVLAWDTALQGAKDARDGHNVVIHELAHKIDFIDGSADGTPEFETHAERRAWSAALEPAFLAHKARAAKGKKSFLDDYAITNEAEYFAVASEAFFEKPKAFAKQLPDVYESLTAFYKLDLAARVHDEPAKTKGGKKPTASKPHAKPAHAKDAPRAKGAPSRKSSPVLAVAASAASVAPAPFRKTAAMSVVALPIDDAPATPKSATKASTPPPDAAAKSAPTRKSSPVIRSAKAAAARKSSPAITAPPAAATTAKSSTRKSSPAIALPPAVATPAKSSPRGKSSAAIVVPPIDVAAAAKASPRGKSSAAIAVPHVDIAAPAPRFRKTAAMSIVTLPEDLVDADPPRKRR